MTAEEFIKQAHDHSKGKVCSRPKCKQHNPQPLSEFNKGIQYKDGLKYECKSCAKVYSDNMCPFLKWFNNKKHNAKRIGIEFTIEPEDIPGVKIRRFKSRNGHWTWEATQYPKVCPVLGIKLDWGMNGNQPNSPSLDRIDPRFGYIPGNVRLVCQSYNMAKGNCPPDEWDIQEKKIAKNILSHPQLDTNPNQIGLF